MILPLRGVRVLDLTIALAGPFGAMLLGDMGADIIKIESPDGDPVRTTPPHFYKGHSVYFMSFNRNKRSVVIDLKNPRGLEVFYDLVRTADVVFYNFRRGVAERLRINHPALEAINPKIITCNITGFGTRGPDADRRAVDVVVQAVAGGMSITGEEGRPPVRAGLPTGDLSGGLYGVIGILAALIQRNLTGKGMQVDTSLFHTQLGLLTYVANFCLYSGEIPPPMGSGHMGTVPSQVFKTKDSYIALEAGFNKLFAELCTAVGMPALSDDPRFADRQGRKEHRDHLIPILAEVFATRTTSEWQDTLDRHGIPCGPVNDVAEALASPQSVEYAMVQDLPVDGGSIKVLRTPLWFGESTSHPMNPPPRLGEHTREVLSKTLGYDEARIDALISQKVAYSG